MTGLRHASVRFNLGLVASRAKSLEFWALSFDTVVLGYCSVLFLCIVFGTYKGLGLDLVPGLGHLGFRTCQGLGL